MVAVKRHGEAELDVVARVEPATGEVHPDVRAVGERGVTPPLDAVVRRHPAGPLGFVEVERLLERLTVIGRADGG